MGAKHGSGVRRVRYSKEFRADAVLVGGRTIADVAGPWGGPRV